MIRKLAFVSAVALMFTGCASTQKSPPLKARQVDLSPFIEHPAEMKPQRERAPFSLVWVTPELPARRAAYRSIYIAPVDTRHLRAAKTTLSTKVTGKLKRDQPVGEFASLMRSSFADAFKNSPAPRLRLASSPQSGGVTLQLALVELNPTDGAGNVVKTAAPYGGVLSPFTGGSVAIEGKVRDSATGELLFEFADTEKDKSSLVSARDFQPYAHAKVAIAEWAAQFEELTRTPPDHKVKDSLFFTLNPL
ncbi:MAG: DUF3313 family protein [Verrucomicrobiales bacterium]